MNNDDKISFSEFVHAMVSIENKKPSFYDSAKKSDRADLPAINGYNSESKKDQHRPSPLRMGRISQAQQGYPNKGHDENNGDGPPDVNQFIAFEEFKARLDAEYGVMGPPRGVYCVPETKVLDFLK
jgi:hypothetical protein